ncbi:MAG: SGNH/GDSL hydrolase family protein [Microbacterium sp.]
MSEVRIESYAPGAGAGRVVVCIGDSITHGQVSAPWVEQIASRLAPSGTTVVNAGVNGELAWNVLQRLDPVVDAQPDAVTLLIGTNDVCARFGPEQAAMYRQMQGLPADPTAAWFEENYLAILDRLRAETHARIAAIEIPPVGERLDSDINEKVRAYNAVIRSAAAERGIEVLPLYELLVAALPDQHDAPAYTGDVDVVIQASRARAGGLSWNEISARNGLHLLVDQVHLNDRAGALLADLVAGFLEEAGTVSST